MSGINFIIENFPTGIDNSQRRLTAYGEAYLVRDEHNQYTSTYRRGGIRAHFTPAEPLKAVLPMPNWVEIEVLDYQRHLNTKMVWVPGAVIEGMGVNGEAEPPYFYPSRCYNDFEVGDIVQLIRMRIGPNSNPDLPKLMAAWKSVNNKIVTVTYVGVNSGPGQDTFRFLFASDPHLNSGANTRGYAVPIKYRTVRPLLGPPPEWKPIPTGPPQGYVLIFVADDKEMRELNDGEDIMGWGAGPRMSWYQPIRFRAEFVRSYQ